MRSTIERVDTDELLRVLGDEAPVGICVIQDGKLRYFNSNFPIATGYRANELMDKDSLEIVAPEDRDMVRENTRKMLKGQLSSPYEFRVRRKDGSSVWILGTVKSIRYRGSRAILGSYMEVGERRQAEERIRDSERRYRLLAENIADVVWTVSISCPTRLTYVSPSVTRLLGYSVEEAMTKEMQEIFTPSSFSAAMKALAEETGDEKRKYLARHKSRRLELQLKHKSDSLVDVEVNFSLMRGANGHGDEILAVARDIAGRKRVEGALNQSEERYRTILEEMGDGYFETDLAGNLTFANDALCRLFGYSREELIGMNYKGLTPEEDVTSVFEAYNTVYRTGEPLKDISRRIIRKDGTYAYARSSVFPIRNEKDEIVGFRGVRHDVTERKQAEERLKESEEKYRLLFETSPDCITQLDREGRYLAANPATSESLGVKLEELIGKTVFEVMPREIAQHRFENIRKVFDEWRPQIFEDERGGRYFHHVVIPLKTSDQREVVQVITRDITETKQAEGKLRQSEENYRTLFNSSVIGMYVMDIETMKVVMSNQAAADLIGFGSPEEGIGANPFDFVVPEDREKVLGIAVNEFLQDSRRTHEIQVTDRSGQRRWHSISIARIMHQGRAASLVSFTDITERRQAEEALRRSEQVLESVLESAPDGVYLSDLGGTFLYGNRKAEEIIGYEREELVGKNFLNLGVLPEQELEKAARLLESSEAGKPTGPDELQLTRKDGSRVWTEINTTTIRRGQETLVIGFVRDITERKQAAEALKRSEERYRTILEEMEDSYFEVDLGGHVTFVNNATCRALGYSKKELIGMSYRDFTDEGDVESVFQLFNDVYRTGAPDKGFCWRTVSKDGTRRFAEHSAFPLRDDKGKIIGFRGVGRDVTERREAEEKLRQSRENYRALFDSSVIGAVVVDAETMKVVMANQAAMKMFGFGSPEQGVNPLDFVPPEHRQEDLELIVKEVFEADSRTPVDVPAVAKDGRRIWVSVTAARILHRGRLAALFSFVDITERKRAEEALNLQTAYFQQLFDASPDAIVLMDTNDRAIQTNKGFEKLFGYSSDEVQGRYLTDLIVPEARVREAAGFLQKISNGEVVRKESVRRRKDGNLSEVSVLAYPIRSDGKLVGAFGIYSDITERKKQEQELADELTRRRILVDQSRDGIVVLDEDGRVYEANQRFADMLGYTREEVRDLHAWDWECESPRERILEMVRSVDEAGDHFETRHRRKDGSIYDVEISANGAIFAGQKLVLCVCRDITERRQMEEAVRQNEENYRTLFDSSVVGMVLLDSGTMKIAMANQAAAKIFGFGSTQEGIGANLVDFVLPEDRERALEIARKELFEQDLRQTHEFRVVTRDGREIWTSLTGARITHQGKLAGLISFADITEQKRQRERLMMTDRLASLGELAAGTAHELNNPLTSIIGFSQLLMEKEVPDDIREDLNLIQNEAQRAANVTKNLLTFARRHAPAKQPNQINSIIEDVLALRAHVQKTSAIEVNRRLAPDLPELMVDYFQMQQVFLNIIINAEYFMTQAHGRGTLTVTTERRDSAVTVSIADDGPGIPAENLRRIFDPFFTTKEAGKGTGLGLSICHGIVTEHGGHIYARSQLGKGATVFVELPIRAW
jgi:PAS domain S-box-containing protein